MNLNVIRRRLAGTPRVLAQSGVAVSHTGNITETTLATITLPAGSMGANGQVVIETLWSYTNSANNKTLKAKLGASTFMDLTVTTTALTQFRTRIANRSASSQVGFAAAAGSPFGNSGSALVTSAIDTTAAQTVTLTAQLASAAETITLESYIVQVFPKA